MSANLYPARVQAAVANLLFGPGVCEPALRQAVEAYAAKLGGADRPQVSLADALVEYVGKVALHAHQISDEDVRLLREAGYAEDEIFEITLCASLGASLARLESGMLALAGE